MDTNTTDSTSATNQITDGGKTNANETVNGCGREAKNGQNNCHCAINR